MSIEGVVLEHFSALTKAGINSTTPSRKHHTVFHYFLYDDSKQNTATTNAHTKCLIVILRDKNY